VGATALERQQRRLRRLLETGVGRATVFVHDECRFALDVLRPYLVEARRVDVLQSMVAHVNKEAAKTGKDKGPQHGVFRYPGGKSWLIPEIKNWIMSSPRKSSVFVEPFGGGAIAGLTVAAEGLAPRVFLSEIDDDVAAVWKTIFSERNADVEWLCERIRAFVVDVTAVDDVLRIKPQTMRGRAFKAIVRNRMSRGGLMTEGAGLLKRGENGKGLASRWYPETLIDRIQALREIRHRVAFEQSDALEVISRFASDPDALYFIDPPYTAGGNHAGRRLYTHNKVDHQALFELVASVAGRALMTYHDVPEVRSLAERQGFEVREVSMKTTHHKMQSELLILKL